jgi:hypothetical protein
MKCENLQFNLSLYLDDILTKEERALLDAHLVCCPLCRQKLDNFRFLRIELQQNFQTPAMPKDLLASVKTAMRTENKSATKSPKRYFSGDFLEFLQMRVMPYTVGVAASLFFGFSLLWILLSGFGSENTSQNPVVETNRQPTIFITKTNPTSSSDNLEISPADIVSQRFSVSGESPSINPQGALVELAQSFTNRKIKGNELVVVADVFSDGLANIEEVVEPLDNHQTVYDLEKAFNQNSNDAPFVPAFLDKRADSVRVVLKIQRVDVNTSKPKTKKR